MADHNNMDDKNLDTKNGSSYSSSSEEKDEDTLSGNSFEPSLDTKGVLEVSVTKDCSINHENYSTPSDESEENVCTASSAEMDKSNRIDAYEKSSLGSENLTSTRLRAFTGHREQSGYSADNSASESSTTNISEEEISPRRTFERKLFSSELKNDTNIASCSREKMTTHSYAEDTQTSPSTQRVSKNMQSCDALSRSFDSLKIKGKFAYLPNTANLRSSFRYGSVDPWRKKALVENEDNGTLNPFENFSDTISPLNNVTPGMQGPQSDIHSFIGNRASNESDISDEPKIIFKNNHPILKDMKETEQCYKICPIDGETDKEKSLNDTSEIMTCSILPNSSENVRRNYFPLKNREEISHSLDLPSIDKENHPNEIDVCQHKTITRSESYSPIGNRESNIMKPSSAAESPTGTLKNIDINLTKRPASPNDNLYPESHDMMKKVKKQKIE